MKIQKQIALLCVLAAPAVASATGLSFQTLAPTAGEIRLSNGSNIASTVQGQFGTLTGNLGLTAVASFTFADFTSNFVLGPGTLSNNNFTVGGDLTGSIPAASYAADTNLWLLVDTGAEQGAFFLGTTPVAGVLPSTPAGATPVIGTQVGNDLRLAGSVVPEPSAFAFISGALALTCVMIRRRA